MLPEKWSIKITDENMPILGKWRDVGTLSALGWLLSYAGGAKGYHVHSIEPYSEYTEITWEQFYKEVLYPPIESEIINYQIY